MHFITIQLEHVCILDKITQRTERMCSFDLLKEDEIEASIKEVNRILENSSLGAESMIMRPDSAYEMQKALLAVEHN